MSLALRERVRHGCLGIFCIREPLLLAGVQPIQIKFSMKKVISTLDEHRQYRACVKVRQREIHDEVSEEVRREAANFLEKTLTTTSSEMKLASALA